MGPVPTSRRTSPARAASGAIRKAAPKVGRRKSTEPGPTLVLLVRHGKTPTTGKVLPGRASGLHLADEGQAQAEAVAQRISELAKAPTAVYASPLERTRETAAPIAKALGLRVRTVNGLLECNVGSWTGEELKTLYKAPEWSAVQKWPSGFRFPGGESFAELSSRANDAIVDLVARHRGETIVAVSHADPIKAIVASASGVPLDLFQRFVVSPCSVSAILYGGTAPYVLCVNSTGTLKDVVLS
jgi:probable phosphomutase (TIGR03848 family)